MFILFYCFFLFHDFHKLLLHCRVVPLHNILFLLICMNVETFKWNYMVKFCSYSLHLTTDLESLAILADILNTILNNNESTTNRQMIVKLLLNQAFGN